MKGRRLIPPWLRRGFEAGVIGALLAVGTLVAFQLSRPAPRLDLPNGLDGALILVPAVVALGIFVVSYPTFLAATREDAVLGVVAAFLVAADVLMLVSLVARDEVMVHPLGRSLPLGAVAAAVAVPVALAGLLVGQLTTPLGFGRLAGLRSALGGAALGLILVIVVAYSI
ncbi:MAG: hypothetical protein ABSB75_07665 [Candidatus Limnocylindrales bacterium]